MEVIHLDQVKKQNKDEVVEHWRMFFEKLLALIKESPDNFGFCLVVREPVPEDPSLHLENLFHYGFSLDEVFAILERAKISLIIPPIQDD